MKKWWKEVSKRWKKRRSEFHALLWEEKKKEMLDAGWVEHESPQAMVRQMKQRVYPREKMQTPKRQTRFTYTEGPMYYLGQQIVKGMQDAGYPAKIIECYRSPERQLKVFSEGHSKATAWQSPHQYNEAVDIVHPSKYWNVSEEYWTTLAAVVEIVAEKYSVQLTHGHTWKFRDSAHIQLADWKRVRNAHRALINYEGKPRPRTKDELWRRFEEVLPAVARSHKNRR